MGLGFWAFMLGMSLLIPLTMLFFGMYFSKGGPKHINAIFGYRTARSRASQAAWEFAHRYCGKLWWKAGWAMLALSVGAMLPLVGCPVDTVGIWGGGLVLLQTLCMVATVIPVEAALKRTFDSRGKVK